MFRSQPLSFDDAWAVSFPAPHAVLHSLRRPRAGDGAGGAGRSVAPPVGPGPCVSGGSSDGGNAGLTRRKCKGIGTNITRAITWGLVHGPGFSPSVPMPCNSSAHPEHPRGLPTDLSTWLPCALKMASSLQSNSSPPSPAVASFKADDKTFETSEVMDERHVAIHQGCIQVSGLAAGVYR